MTHPTVHHHTHRPRPSNAATPPSHVGDILLWRLAVDVAAAHQRDAAGDCVNLACATQRGTCAAARLAQHALRAASRPADRQPRPLPVPALPSRMAAPSVVGRAAVTAGRRFTGWFTSTRTAGPAYAAPAMTYPQRLAA